MDVLPELSPPVVAGLVLGGLTAVATARIVYRGGTTLNDHAVAAVVVGCVAVWPLLWWGAVGAGLAGPSLALLMGLGMSAIFGLFFVLGRKREATGALLAWARIAQPAYAFSLWAGLLLVLWAPFALLTGRPPLWPGALLLLPAGLALAGTAWTYGAANRVRRHALSLPGLAGELRLAHLSDLHASPVTPGPELLALVDRVNALEPDLVAITGDLLMPFSEAEHGYLIDALARLQAPAVACPGNHDLPVCDRLRDELAAIGIPLLVDERCILDIGGRAVECCGLDFRWTSAQAHLDQVLPTWPPVAADLRLLLAHDPRLFRPLPAGRFDLVLSGHTHGGQIGLDLIGLPWSVLRPLGVYDQGHWRRAGADGETLLYVHRGNWNTGLPPRMGIASEIVVHRIGVGEGCVRPRARPAP
ncbi:MAG: metallophosphoesterase [Alphaproteobacteria bacterium]|nr:metallophosphoesterase [Alphaproteobacteria bacterium]